MRGCNSFLSGLLVLILGAGVFAPAASATDMDAANEVLVRLETKLKKRSSINAEITGALDEVMEAYKGLQPPEDEAEKAKFEREADKFRKKVHAYLFDALTMVHLQRENNLREDVNIKAAEILATLGDDPEVAADLSPHLIRAMQHGLLDQKKYDVSQVVLEKAFTALGSMNQPKALDWILEKQLHANGSPARAVRELIGALKGLLAFKQVPGKLRYKLVDKMITLYTGVESQAEQNVNDTAHIAKKQFWDQIKNDVIQVLQKYTGAPNDDQGQAIANMAGFQEWFRHNDKERRPPWTDA